MWVWTFCHESRHEDKATDDHYFVLVCIVALVVKNLPTSAADSIYIIIGMISNLEAM